MTHDFGTFVFRNKYKDFVNSAGKIVIGNNVVIGQNVTILKNVTIGNNCIVGIGSIVTRDIPDNTVAAGVPAKVLCSLDDYYLKRKRVSTDEALFVGQELIRNKGVLRITDLKEEWSVFLSKTEYDMTPSIHAEVDHRIRGIEDDFFKSIKPFTSFDDFKKACENSIS